MSFKTRFFPLPSPVKETHIVPDPEQLPFDIDHIKCPNCKKVQSAKILHDWPEYHKIHPCVYCGHVIRESEWNSIQ